MKSLRERLVSVHSVARRGALAEALDALDALREEAMSSGEAGERSTYLQTRASVLDDLGKSEEALELAKEALAIDLEHWPDSRGTFLSLHSLVLILQRLGRRDEAALRARELLALGEKLGGVEFAASVSVALEHVEPSERLALLERARFHLKVVLRDSPPKGQAYVSLARTFTSIATRLGREYAAAGRLPDAERLLCATTRLLAPFISELQLRRSLAYIWCQLAFLGSCRGALAEQRLFLRYALVTFDAQSTRRRDVEAELGRLGGLVLAEDLQPLDAFRFLRAGEPAWVCHPSQGCFPLSGSAARTDWSFGDVIDVTLEQSGIAHLKQ